MTYSLRVSSFQRQGLTIGDAQQRIVAEWLLSESHKKPHIPQTPPSRCWPSCKSTFRQMARPAPTLAARPLGSSVSPFMLLDKSFAFPPHTFETSETVNGNQISLIICIHLRGPRWFREGETLNCACGTWPHPTALPKILTVIDRVPLGCWT